MRTIKRTDKGVAGLTILLSLVTLLFVIGLIVMIFSLMGGEMQDATYTSTTTAVANETEYANVTLSPTSLLDSSTLRNAVCSLTQVVNDSNNVVITSGNYSLTASTCTLNVSTASDVLANYTWDITYSVTYDADNDATRVMGNTTEGIAGVVDWFDIFLVIGAMVVLILLTVIIITAIRGSGLIADGSA